MPEPHFSPRDILWQLDEFPRRSLGMPKLDNGGCYPIEGRLTGYRDDRFWAIALEFLIFSPRAVGHSGIITNVFSYGNGLRVKVGGNNVHNVVVASDGPEGPTFAFDDYPPDSAPHPDNVWEYVHPGAKTIRIRGEVVPIETDPDSYEEMGIHLMDPPRVKGHELLRGLPPIYRKMLLATEDERFRKFKKSARVPMIIQLDEWYHPALSQGEYPSESESFQMLAEVLATGDRSRYQPKRLPNTHWSNWPQAGIFTRPAVL